MDLASLFALAVGLSMDAAAVAAGKGLAARELRARHYAIVALTFGGFQALMPLAGFMFGVELGPLVEAFDHYIVFVLLCGLGAKMIYEAWGDGDAAGGGATAGARGSFDAKQMLVLGVATSLDAFAVGITLPMLGAKLAVSLAVIGLTTAVLSALALALGRRLGEQLGPRLDAFGGVVLIVLGSKILAEHLGFLG